VERLGGALRAGRLVLCSVVAEEIMAGARNQQERQNYDAFFTTFLRLGLVVTPTDAAWRRCGRLLSRYRERYGAIAPRDHQNDVLIVLSALQLAQTTPTTLLTENDADLIAWRVLAQDRSALRIEALRGASLT
jgi:predicted nucleic acid-binding protein